MKIMRSVVYMAVLSILLSACGGLKSWSGEKPNSEEEKVAYEMCKCVVSVFEAEGISEATLVKAMQKVNKLIEDGSLDGKSEEEFKAEYPDLSEVMSVFQKQDPDEITCVADLQIKLEGMANDGDGAIDMYRKHCILHTLTD